MTVPLVLPEPLLARFRAAAFERLERIDTTWTALTQGSAPSRADEDMFRELHTLKGDARVVGFADVAMLCQRLEDLLSAARGRRYRVHEDVDVVVTMAIQFAGMLLRKKAGATRGIDLEGFLTQIEVVLAEWLRRTSSPPPPSSLGKHMRLDAGARGAGAACDRLSGAATDVYLEHLRAEGAPRDRLRGIWDSLRREIAELEAVPLGPAIAGHLASARDLARQFGKEVDASFEGPDVRVAPDVFDVLNTAVLHAVRNAVDHGLDTPEARARAGKPAAGALRVSVRAREDAIDVAVRDDGCGVDFDAVRARAQALGIDTGPDPDEESLAEVLFVSGFSTREGVTEISGRGLGLDAVRAAVWRLGGTVRLETARGAGTTIHVTVPSRRRPLDVRVFGAPGAPLVFAVDASWEEYAGPETPAAADPLALLALPGPGSPPATATPLVLRKADRCCALFATGAPRRACALRPCPTPDDAPVEVVELAEGDALLLRPGALPGLSLVEVSHG